jgi:hypothetical protein
MAQFIMESLVLVTRIFNFIYIFSHFVCFKACGSSSFTQNLKIVGGKPAVANSWPAQIFLYIEYIGYNAGKSYIIDGECGGTLLDAYTVLTAAHCILQSTEYVTINGNRYPFTVTDPLNPSQYTVYVGANNISFISTGSTPPFPTVAMAVKNVIKVSSQNSMVPYLYQKIIVLKASKLCFK